MERSTRCAIWSADRDEFASSRNAAHALLGGRRCRADRSAVLVTASAGFVDSRQFWPPLLSEFMPTMMVPLKDKLPNSIRLLVRQINLPDVLLAAGIGLAASFTGVCSQAGTGF